MTREEKQIKFRNDNWLDMFNLYYANRDKRGYVSIYADKDFNPYGLKFQMADSEFNESDFINPREGREEFNGDEVIDSEYAYFEILWSDDQTKWRYKELFNTRETKDYNKFN